MLHLTIVSPSQAAVGAAPGGIGYLAEMYEAAGWSDGLSRRQLPDDWLFAGLARLRRRYPGRLRIRWVNPYSLAGLFLTFRFRIRSFPTIIVDGEVVEPVGGPADLERIVAARLGAARA